MHAYQYIYYGVGLYIGLLTHRSSYVFETSNVIIIVIIKAIFLNEKGRAKASLERHNPPPHRQK